MTDGSLEQQVQAYTKARDDYELLARRLEEVLERARDRIAPQAFVHTRVKSISSFAEKALRKKDKRHDPIHDFTDLCGVRVVARTRSEVDAFATYVKGNFEIDEANSSDTSQRLQPSEFGYRSVHYIVSFKPGVDYGRVIEPNLYGLKAEVQLRTVAEHAYADFGHDLSYKGAFELPNAWKRELAGIAASVEGIDQAFDRIEKGVRAYSSSAGAYKSEEQLRAEIARLELVLAYEPDLKLALRIAALAMTLEDWLLGEEILERYVDRDRPEDADHAALRDYGYCLCNVHRSAPSGDDYARGRRYLDLAANLDLDGAADPTAVLYLADTYAWVDDDGARELYRRAYEADPTNSYALARFLQYAVGRPSGGVAILAALRPTLEAAAARCRAQAAVKVNVPRAFFGIGTFLLLQNTEESAREALKAYAKAVQAAGAGAIADELSSLKKLLPVADQLVGYEWARRMLLLGLATKPLPSDSPERELTPERAELRARVRERDRQLREDAKAELSTLSTGRLPAKPAVVIVVGSTRPEEQTRLDAFRTLIVEAFRDFEGIVISGGTKEGVSGFVGEIGELYGERIYTFAHHPRELPTDGTATRDDRYDEIRVMEDQPSFSALQPLQDWIDIVETGIDPRDVKILGLNGGHIAAVEFRIGLGLGASVAVLESGREATKLLKDEVWAVSETLLPMPADPQTVRAFIGPGVPPLDPYIREEMAKLIDKYHQEQANRTWVSWAEIPERNRRSSRSQAEHNLLKLGAIGCEVVTVDEPPTDLFQFTPAEVEELAEMEHGRWTAELLKDGWRVGEKKDEDAKTHPLLVAWEDLPEKEREWDRNFVRAIPELLARFNRDIREIRPNPDRPPRRKRAEESAREAPTVHA